MQRFTPCVVARDEGRDMLGIRRATAADYANVTRWMGELAVDDDLPDEARWREQFLPGTIIAELARAGAGPRSVGYAFRVQTDRDVYVRNLVSDPAFRRRGIGRALMSWIAREARRSGATTWRLNVKPDNLPALGLYTSLGMTRAHASAAVRVELEVCARLRAKRTVARIVAPAQWSVLEAHHGLVSGTIVSRVERGDLILATRDRRGLRSLAVFDRSFSGAFLFRPADAEDAESLLRAMLVSCEPGAGIVQVVVENDEPIVSHLVERGAYVQMRFLHYAGALPV